MSARPATRCSAATGDLWDELCRNGRVSLGLEEAGEIRVDLDHPRLAGVAESDARYAVVMSGSAEGGGQMTAADLAGAPRQLGMPLPFEEAEYARRLDAARAALAEARLDAIILFHQESLHYLFGYDQLGYWIYQPVVLTAEASEVTVLARPLDHDLIEGLPFVRELLAWRDDSAAHDDPSGLTREMLADLGLLGAGRRIGIELRTHALLPYYHEKLCAALDGHCELVDASDLITELRLRKSDAEVAYAREAGRIMDAGFAAGFAAMRPGATEADVASPTP